MKKGSLTKFYNFFINQSIGSTYALPKYIFYKELPGGEFLFDSILADFKKDVGTKKRISSLIIDEKFSVIGAQIAFFKQDEFLDILEKHSHPFLFAVPLHNFQYAVIDFSKKNSSQVLVCLPEEKRDSNIVLSAHSLYKFQIDYSPYDPIPCSSSEEFLKYLEEKETSFFNLFLDFNPVFDVPLGNVLPSNSF